MGSKKEVSHTGIVKERNKEGITVSILTQAGCVSCQIKDNCNMSDQSEKELDIKCDPLLFTPGQRVEVLLRATQGMNAIFLGYILPFIVLMAVMIVTSKLTQNEGIIGIAALTSLIPYYLVLFVFKNQIKKKFTYVVKPLN